MSKPNIFKKKSKFYRWINGKGKWVILSTGLFLLIGIACIIVGFGLAYGWDYVGKMFCSQYAYMIYALIGILVFIAIWIIYRAKIKEE